MSKTKTMIVSRSRTMHPQSPPLTIRGTVLIESDDHVIFGVTFDTMMTFEKHFRPVSRADFKRLSILQKSWRVFHDDRFLGDAFVVLYFPFWSTIQQCGTLPPIHSLNYRTV